MPKPDLQENAARPPTSRDSTETRGTVVLDELGNGRSPHSTPFVLFFLLGNYLKELKVSKIAMVGKRLLFIFFVVLLSQTGNGALQLPLGKQTNSDAPISELPLAHDSITRELNFVSFELRISPRLAGISGQFMA